METPDRYGKLYIVATPLGHLDDITFRAVKTLRQVDLIAAEDTRHSRRLLAHYGISTRLVSCHEHNERQMAGKLISDLKKGTHIALISDAGTPTISDPGYHLVAAAVKERLTVVPIPGCSAAIAGLSVSGLPTDTFMFMGFLPRKEGKRQQVLATLKSYPGTLILYESPKRVKKLIRSVIQVYGDRKGCLAREITKLHEEIIRGPLSEILHRLDQKEAVKGECALFIAGCPQEKKIDDTQLERIIQERLHRDSTGTAGLAKEISEEFQCSRKKAYDLILKLKPDVS